MIHRPDVSVITIHGKTPQIDDSAFVAPGCRIIGDVTIGPEASIWYNCVLRADVSRIVIGARSNIQDGSVVHCDGAVPGVREECPTIIGDDVLIGHMAMIETSGLSIILQFSKSTDAAAPMHNRRPTVWCFRLAA